ncbi:hypothetical protein CPC08DRAFT_802042 [Agrocybe pediades]|nr:hypothetical protein CPC08DRAFT_802042 [Agrocybe pediades]
MFSVQQHLVPAQILKSALLGSLGDGLERETVLIWDESGGECREVRDKPVGKTEIHTLECCSSKAFAVTTSSEVEVLSTIQNGDQKALNHLFYIGGLIGAWRRSGLRWQRDSSSKMHCEETASTALPWVVRHLCNVLGDCFTGNLPTFRRQLTSLRSLNLDFLTFNCPFTSAMHTTRPLPFSTWLIGQCHWRVLALASGHTRSAFVRALCINGYERRHKMLADLTAPSVKPNDHTQFNAELARMKALHCVLDCIVESVHAMQTPNLVIDWWEESDPESMAVLTVDHARLVLIVRALGAVIVQRSEKKICLRETHMQRVVFTTKDLEGLALRLNAKLSRVGGTVKPSILSLRWDYSNELQALDTLSDFSWRPRRMHRHSSQSLFFSVHE